MGSQGSREPVTKNKTKIANRLLNHSELVHCQIHKYFFATLTLHLIIGVGLKLRLSNFHLGTNFLGHWDLKIPVANFLGHWVQNPSSAPPFYDPNFRKLRK